MGNEELKEIMERRTMAYIDMLKAAYQVDDDGLADLLGMEPDEWEREYRAEWDDRSAETFVKLARLVKSPLEFLFCEDIDGCEHRSPDKDRAREMRERFNELYHVITHGKSVMTVCSTSMLELAMGLSADGLISERQIETIFGFHDICELEAEYFDRALENA